MLQRPVQKMRASVEREAIIQMKARQHSRPASRAQQGLFHLKDQKVAPLQVRGFTLMIVAQKELVERALQIQKPVVHRQRPANPVRMDIMRGREGKATAAPPQKGTTL
ncbi:MAG: hypothetical protein COB46_14425 [Rhodospirillaceae bacterium]|nr:MAG: hypothetical protein COB46_14425 [Rhodospirillaceae bacterium]